MSDEVFKFDTSKVSNLESKLKSAKKNVDDALNEIEKKVNNIQEWWKGPEAVGAFVDTFKKSKKSVSEAINEWIKKEKECIAEAQQIMDTLDKSLKIESQAATNPTAGMTV